MDPVFAPIYGRPQPTEVPQTPTFVDTLTSAFKLENDVANLYDYMTREFIPADPNFDFKKTFSESGMPDDWYGLLAPATSEADFQRRVARVKEETEARHVLAASGTGGFVAAIGAGILSPTSFIPFVGPARRGWALAEIIALGAAAGTLSESALYLNQDTRTETEALTGIAAQTLLSGMLGAAWLGLSKSGRARLAGSVEYGQLSARVPSGNLDSGRVAMADVRTAPITRAEYEARLRLPDVEGRDRGTPEVARVEPAPAPGRLRIYAAWTDDGAISTISRVREDAASVDGAVLSYVDLDEVSPTAQQILATGKIDAAEVPQELWRPIYKGADPEGMSLLRRDLEADEAAELDTAPSQTQGAIPEAAPIAGDRASVGAAASRSRNTMGPQAAPNRVRQAMLDTLGKISPTYRMQKNTMFPSLRDAAFKLDGAGIRQGGLDVMEPSADGGSVLERIRGYDYYVKEVTDALDLAYFRHVYPDREVVPNNLRVAVVQLKSRFDMLPEGKMSWEEFNAKVYDDLSTGVTDPATKSAVDGFRKFFANYNNAHKEYIKELEARGVDIEPLYKELLEDKLGVGVSEYAHQIYDPRLIRDNSAEFLADHAKHYEKQLIARYERDYKRFLKRKAALEAERSYVALDPKEQAKALAEAEAGIAFIDELPEIVRYREERLSLTRQARAEGWERSRLSEFHKELLENSPKEVKELLAERSGLLASTRSMKKLGGNAEKEITRFTAEVEKAGSLIEDMFRQTIPAIERLDLRIQATQEASDKMAKSAKKELGKALKTLEKRRASYAKLLESSRPNMKSRDKAVEMLERQRVKYETAQQRMDIAFGKNVAFDERLSELNLIREDVIADTTALVRSRAARAEEAAEKVAEAEAKILTPEERIKAVTDLEKRLVDHEVDFSLKWSNRGERSGDPTIGTPDFKEKALETATFWERQLTGADVVPSYFVARQGERGPELMRMLALPYDVKKKYLVRNVETVSRAYDRVMGPDLEIWRAFGGSVNGSSLLREMGQEADNLKMAMFGATHVKLPAKFMDNSASFISRVQRRIAEIGENEGVELTAANFSREAKEGFAELTSELRTQINNTIDAALKHQTRNFDIAIKRLRNTRMVPQDPESLMWRSGRAIKDINVITMMGGVVLSSVADIARPIYQHGVTKTLSQGWAPFVTNIKSASGVPFRVAAKDVNARIGLTLEPLLHGRAQGMIDALEPHVAGRSRLERGIRFLSQKTGLVALFDYWTAGMKSVSGAVVHATLGTYIPTVAKALARGGEASADELKMLDYLRNLGLRDNDILRIAAEMQKPGGMEEFSNGGFLPNMDQWEDMAAYRAYGAAVRTEVNKLIVTPGLERPNWTDENLAYSLLAQFKSFTFSATSKMAMSGLQGNDPYLFQGVVMSLAFGALSYYTYAIAAGDKAYERMKKDGVNDWIYEAVDRSGLLGVLSIPQQIGERIPALAQYEIFGGADKVYRRPAGFFGTVFGPTAGQAEKLVELVMNMDGKTDSEKAKAISAFRQLFVPYQNHFLLRRMFTNVEKAML